MASNRNRFFIPHPVIPDSSKLRFSQGCNSFNIELFSAAAKADRMIIDSIRNLGLFVNQLKNNQNKLHIELIIKTSLERAKESLIFIAPRKIRPQRSPNAPNTAPALSLVAA
jgi:hypothetical protein